MPGASGDVAQTSPIGPTGGSSRARRPWRRDAGSDARAACESGASRASPYTQPAMRFLSRFFDNNDRELSRIQPLIDRTNELEPEYEALSDEEIRERIDLIRAEVLEAAEPEEPSEDELHSPDLERRRDLAKARRKRENERLGAAPWTTSSRRCSPPAARP